MADETDVDVLLAGVDRLHNLWLLPDPGFGDGLAGLVRLHGDVLVLRGGGGGRHVGFVLPTVHGSITVTRGGIVYLRFKLFKKKLFIPGYTVYMLAAGSTIRLISQGLGSLNIAFCSRLTTQCLVCLSLQAAFYK